MKAGLGGDNRFLKSIFTLGYYFPAPLKTTYNIRAQVGMISGGAPIYEKFFVGGLQTLRGFDYGMAGPVDLFSGVPLGADRVLTINNELTFPLAREIGLRGAGFIDIGKGANEWPGLFPLRIAYGFGIRWRSPFGPIHIDLGFNPFPKRGEKKTVPDFTAGSVY